MRFILISIFTLALFTASWGAETKITFINDVCLGNLFYGEKQYYLLQKPYLSPQVSIALYGHIYQADDPAAFLTFPNLLLERMAKNSTKEQWLRVQLSQYPNASTHVARIQNIALDPNYDYRICVFSSNGGTGRYALICDPSYPESEFVVEDISIPKTPDGHTDSIYSAYAVSNPSNLKSRVYVGSDHGYVLRSDDNTKTWSILYPVAGQLPSVQPIHSIFVDSTGIIYISPWVTYNEVLDNKIQGQVLESRDGGKSWQTALQFSCTTGVAWRMCEDREGNVFIGEYTSVAKENLTVPLGGNIWRRKNHGRSGEHFERVYSQLILKKESIINHVHFIGVDPYTNDVYAALGDNENGRFIRSKQHGDPGSWETLETGVDSQYTAMAFTPFQLFLGQDTSNQFKKIVQWNKLMPSVTGSEPFWTTSMIDLRTVNPVPWFDKGNWFWGHYFKDRNTLCFQYLPYGLEIMNNGQMQSPRLYATKDNGKTWWKAITFPPIPQQKPLHHGFWGPKSASNISPDGWVYSTWGTCSPDIHQGFRFKVQARTEK